MHISKREDLLCCDPKTLEPPRQSGEKIKADMIPRGRARRASSVEDADRERFLSGRSCSAEGLSALLRALWRGSSVPTGAPEFC